MNQIIDFIVRDAAFKLSQGMVIKPEEFYNRDIGLFIDEIPFKWKILSFIICKTANGIEGYAYDYKLDEDTLNYFKSLSTTERSAISQRVLDEIKKMCGILHD